MGLARKNERTNERTKGRREGGEYVLHAPDQIGDPTDGVSGRQRRRKGGRKEGRVASVRPRPSVRRVPRPSAAASAADAKENYLVSDNAYDLTQR